MKLESNPNRHLREAALVHNLRHSSEILPKNLKEKTTGRFRARGFSFCLRVVLQSGTGFDLLICSKVNNLFTASSVMFGLVNEKCHRCLFTCDVMFVVLVEL